MVDVFLVVVLLMAGLTLAEGDAQTAQGRATRQSDTPRRLKTLQTERAASTPCATLSPHWRDLSTPGSPW